MQHNATRQSTCLLHLRYYLIVVIVPRATKALYLSIVQIH